MEGSQVPEFLFQRELSDFDEGFLMDALIARVELAGHVEKNLVEESEDESWRFEDPEGNGWEGLR